MVGTAQPMGAVASVRARPRSIFRPRRYQRSPDREASRRLRYRLATSGPLPPHLAAPFTIAHLAVLRIVADECAAKGVCTAYVEEMAARAGVCRRSAQHALREAEQAGLIATIERPRKGRPHDTNVIAVVDTEWLAWIEQGKRPGPKGKTQNFAPHGQGYNSEPLETSEPKKAADERMAEIEQPDLQSSDLHQAMQSEAMPRMHASVRSDEQEPSTIEILSEMNRCGRPGSSSALNHSRYRPVKGEGAFRLGPHAERLMALLAKASDDVPSTPLPEHEAPAWDGPCVASKGASGRSSFMSEESLSPAPRMLLCWEKHLEAEPGPLRGDDPDPASRLGVGQRVLHGGHRHSGVQITAKASTADDAPGRGR